MASASSPPRQEKFDVFLSFRGEDTRNGFTSHLNAALCQKKIKTFIDDELRRGDEISPSLLKAIEGSKISIIIFSKGYASSTWCLKELIEILHCKKMYGQIVIPVFYGIDPSHVRKQEGTFEDAFAEHKVRFRERKEMLQRWRSALTEAANLSGFDSNVVRPESKLIERIIEHTLTRLNYMSSIDNKNLIGIAMKIQEIKSLLSDEPKEVCKVGIWGMGGMGKTTLANAVFNDISSQFEASCFLENVRETSEKGELSRLRKKLNFAILEDKHLNIRLSSTKERLGRKRMLIVFDDVTNLKQIKELIEDFEYVGIGSRISITTRDKHVLEICGLDDSTIYEVEGLCSDDSLQLFKHHAFKQNHLINEDYMKLSNRVISYSKGVPLALEVLGCFLLGREKFEWESTLEKLKNCPHQDIQTVLKISYDGLDDEEKDLFLDVACFFNGWDEHLVRKFSSSIGLRVLIDKALITISYKTIRVHDLLQEMGMEIVRKESVNKPGQRSRLWHDNDVYDVLKKNKGTDKIRGLRFDISEIREIHLNPHAFSEMDYLRFLIVNKSKYGGNNNNVHGFEGQEFDFSELRCLYWDSYHFTSLPSKFYPQNLVVLTMRNNNLEQLWSGVKDLANIKYIDLSYSEHLLKIPDLSKAQNLECLILEDCTSLLEITAPSQNLDKLVSLNLRNCKSLINLPIGIQSKSLREVILSGCSCLNTAPRISCNMERLCLDGTAIKTLSPSIESPSRLVQLKLAGCSGLESLPSSVCNFNFLRMLILSGSPNLKFVLGIPRNIKELYLDGAAIKELSSSIENASNLRILSLKDCSSLESLPDGICRLKSLIYLFISGCSKLDRLPKDIGNLDSLEVLEATGSSKDCLRLESLPSSIRNLNLRFLNLSDLVYLKMVPEFPWRIEELYLDGTTIKELSTSIENASSLVRLSVKDCLSLESLPNSICKLKSLKYLFISGCSKLDRLPADIGDLESLKVLEADGTNFESVPTSIINLSALELLSVRFCNRLQSLPKLPCSMQEVNADGCKLLKVLSGLKISSDGLNWNLCSFINCFNLDWNAVGTILNDALLNMYSNRTFLFERVFFSLFEKRRVRSPKCFMVFPGSEIPEWFDIQSNGSRIEVPHGSFNHKFLGFVVCAIVGIQDYVSSAFDLTVGYELRLKFQNGSKVVNNPVFTTAHIKSDHVFVGSSFSTSNFREFACNPDAIINFSSSKHLIKKCGVRLLFAQEFREAMKRSKCSIIFDKEEAHSKSKRLKSSNLFQGESSSRS